MKEVIHFALPRKDADIPETVLERFKELNRLTNARSTLLWGEHCSECGFPDCYTSCSFYVARQDYHCRRFEEGLRSAGTDGVELMSVQFGKWGKLEADGPAPFLSRKKAQSRESRIRTVSTLINNLPASQDRKNRLAYRVNTSMRLGAFDMQTDGDGLFIIEAYLPQPDSVAFTLSVRSRSDQKPQFFQSGFELKQGYNRIGFPVRDITDQVDLSEPHAVQIEPLAETGVEEVYFGLVDFVDLQDVEGVELISRGVRKRPAPRDAKSAIPAGQTGSDKKVKCVVWDLDNTVWDGTLAEDGIEGLTIRPEVIAMMHKLDARGIINSVASKNDEETGLAALTHFGLQDMMLYPQIGWHPKSKSMESIANSIGIALDTFVFLDDQSFERAEVSENLPVVECLDAVEAAHLLERPRFDVPATAEAATRRLKYKDEEKRVATFLDSGEEYTSFLESCNIKLNLLPIDDQKLSRAYELSQRTNQLNFSGRRYEMAELREMRDQVDTYDIVLMQCEDRFGDYGIIGMAVLNKEQALLESFMMSCRVKGKMVEHAFFSYLFDRLHSDGAETLQVNYRKTERNHASIKILEDLEFAAEPINDTEAVYSSPTAIEIKGASVVAITDLRPELSPVS
ncbi:MAG: HAD-IIIC family phosphatase [Pseudomonadota bacterium]